LGKGKAAVKNRTVRKVVAVSGSGREGAKVVELFSLLKMDFWQELRRP